MAKFLITYKLEKIEYQTLEIEEADVMAALDSSRKRAKALTLDQPENNLVKTVWNVIEIKSLDGE